MKILNNIYKPFLRRFNFFLEKKFEKQKIQNSKNFFFNLELNLEKIEDIDSINYKVFSQNQTIISEDLP